MCVGVCVRGVHISLCAWHVKLQGTADVSCDSICQLVNAPRGAREGGGRGNGIRNDATATLNASLAQLATLPV